MRKPVFITALLLCGCFTAPAQTGQTPAAPFDADELLELVRVDPLRGGPTPHFTVYVGKELQSLLNQEALRTETELVLRRNGVPLLAKQPEGSPWAILHLHVDAVRGGTGAYALRVWLEFSEEASVKRQRPTAPTVIVPTWRDSILMIVGEGRMGSVREDCVAMIERFCLDYLKANPKKAGGF